MFGIKAVQVRMQLTVFAPKLSPLVGSCKDKKFCRIRMKWIPSFLCYLGRAKVLRCDCRTFSTTINIIYDGTTAYWYPTLILSSPFQMRNYHVKSERRETVESMELS